MERLTEISSGGQAMAKMCGNNCPHQFICKDEDFSNCKYMDNLIDRLAAYEDTGMEPEEIKTMREWWSQVPMTIKDQVKRICGGEFTRADRIKQMHPDWSDTFIEEIMYCPYTKKPCSDVEKHNLNLCDSCPETFM